MSVKTAIQAIGSKAAIADNPISYLEKQASDSFFKSFTKRVKSIVPSDHAMWKNTVLKSYQFSDCIITTIKGSIVAVKTI